MPHVFTSLCQPVEKLLEAEHFLARLTHSEGLEFQFELNAFLSASPSVTFVLQESMSDVPPFSSWYAQQRANMGADHAMSFFLHLRNISQKRGPVSLVGCLLPNGRWTYRFVGRPRAVPRCLVGRDIGACCADHLAKLAALLLDCVREFPFDSCPAHAFTEQGTAALRYGWRDIEDAIGLPAGIAEVLGVPPAERLRLLRREIAPLDTATIERISRRDLRARGVPLEFSVSSGIDLADDIAARVAQSGTKGEHPRVVFLRAFLERFSDARSS